VPGPEKAEIPSLEQTPAAEPGTVRVPRHVSIFESLGI